MEWCDKGLLSKFPCNFATPFLKLFYRKGRVGVHLAAYRNDPDSHLKLLRMTAIFVMQFYIPY